MKKRHRLNSSQIISLGFLGIIFVGAFLLSTPLASKNHQWTNFVSSLFTSTSATCVTGLSVVNTGAYWSMFGQILILFLIQIGGIGFMTFFAFAAMLVKRKLDLQATKTLNQSSGGGSIDNYSPYDLIKRITIFTFLIETVGAVFLMFDFIPRFGWGNGIYYSIFTSISAFCNAGFDVFGLKSNSLMLFSSNAYVLTIIMLLIIIGGLGFVVWFDIFHQRGRWSKLSIHTKLVIISTIMLIFGDALLLLFIERDHAFKDLTPFYKVINSLFLSVTCRTAGFTTVDLGNLTSGGKLLSSSLMFIGGSPGSTAGGIKTTTLVILILGLFNVASKKPSIVIGKKRITPQVIRQALTVTTSYLILNFFAMLIIMGIESNVDVWTFGDIFFEVVSASGTTGLATRDTSTLTHLSQIVLIILMYVGRIGTVTLITIFQNKADIKQELLERPEGKILIG